MKIIVLGCGNIGSVLAKDLAENLPSAQIVMADMDKDRAAEAVSRISRNNVSWAQVDASDFGKLVNTLEKFDLTAGTLPGHMGFQSCKAAIKARVNMVDVSYMPEDVMTLNKPALKAGVCLIPDCGMSPGLGNMLVGHSISQLDRVESVHILNGGLPNKPVPPLGYVITWSVKDLIDMYSRRVTIVKQGKAARVQAMSGYEEIMFPGVGKLEAFYTDGLRTLLHTVKDAEDMWEKTLRYPGHIEKIKLLKSLGFFDKEPVEIDGLCISPRELAAKLLERKLKRPDVPDIVAMLIRVSGLRGNRKVTYTYRVLDRYDEKRRVTAMARTTAYTASVVVQLLAGKEIGGEGVVPPEKLGMNQKLYRKFMGVMKNRGIMIAETRKQESFGT